MIKEINLSEDFVTGGEVRKGTLSLKAEIQGLKVDPHTSIKLHGHDNQWEVWLRDSPIKRAYVCLKGEEHELVNKSERTEKIVAIKGQEDYSYDDLASFFYDYGYSVHHGSLIIEE